MISYSDKRKNAIQDDGNHNRIKDRRKNPVRKLLQFSHSGSRVSLFVTPQTAAHQAFLSSPTPGACSNSLPIGSVIPYNHLILYHPLLLLPSIFPSIRVFSNKSVLCIRWPKYWIFSFSISPSNEYSEVISFRINWFDLFAVQGTLKSLLQHYSSKVSILWHSAFFIIELSHLYMTIGKTIALTRWTLVGKAMSLLFFFFFNRLSKLVISFLPRSKCLLISWLQSLSTVTLDPKKIKSVTVYPPIHHGVMGPDAMILVFWKLSFKPDFLPLFFHFH